MDKQNTIGYSGFKYPESIYGKSNFEPRIATENMLSALVPKSVMRPINRVNLQSNSYYKPTMLTREYQNFAP